MGVSDLYSKRQRRLRGELPDVYTYDQIPERLRVQIVHIWHGTLGDADLCEECPEVQDRYYREIVDTLCREHGVFKLAEGINGRDRDYRRELADFLLAERNTDKLIDAVEVSFRMIDRETRRANWLYGSRASQVADEAIEELNARFLEHGVGYQFANGQIIRVDSELLHSEVVKPALVVLRGQQFAGAQQEFLKAHEHYRHGNAKEALNECLKAFESTMKAICDKRGWKYDPRDTSKALIDVCFDNCLVPKFWQSEFSALRSLLEGGVPTGRNKLSGHGQGSTPTEVPSHLVAFILHMTAAAILFLGEADSNLK